MKYIDEISLQGKRVLIRSDFNVPFDENGKIADDTRIKLTIPTIKYAREAGGRLILCSHLGSPKGKRNPSLSLRPVAERLSELLGTSVTFFPDCIGAENEQHTKTLKSGECVLLENLRFHPGEEKNDPAFAEALAALADVYIDDAFATAHRAHASVVGVPKILREHAAGFLMKSEIEYFTKAFENPTRPLIAIFGGAKVSTKMDAIRHVGSRADGIVIGGAMANTFLKAMGHEVGKSLHEIEQVENAKSIKATLEQRGCKVYLPIDMVVASELKVGASSNVVSIDKIPADSMALDIGPKSIELFQSALKDAKTIIWNGPMGAFETKGFEKGTYAIVDALSQSKALTVVGGGDTDLALHECHAMEKMSYVSSAGGAFLKLLEGKTLPGIEALES